MAKSKALEELLDRLSRDAPGVFEVDDRWSGDPHSVSITPAEGPAKLMYLAAGDGTYTYECVPYRFGDVPHQGEFICTSRVYSEVLAAVLWHNGPPGANPPPSFDEQWSSEWGAWVLERGFPPFPDVLHKGHAVPVARHVGGRMGSVLFFEWFWGHDDPDEDTPETEFMTFRRTVDGWVHIGDGGGSGPVNTTFTPFEPADNKCSIGEPSHYAGDGGVVNMTAIGIVTPAAAWLEVEQHGKMHASAIVAPLNLITVIVDASTTAIARVLDSSGGVLATTTLFPQWSGWNGTR